MTKADVDNSLLFGDTLQVSPNRWVGAHLQGRVGNNQGSLWKSS